MSHTKQGLYRCIAHNIELEEEMERQAEEMANVRKQLQEAVEENRLLKEASNELRNRIAELESKQEAPKERTVGWLPTSHHSAAVRKDSLEPSALAVAEKQIEELKSRLINQGQQRAILQQRLKIAQTNRVSVPAANSPSVKESVEYKGLQENYNVLQEQYETIIIGLNEDLEKQKTNGINAARKLLVAENKIQRLHEQLHFSNRLKESQFHELG